jgi:hypothetical protein
VVFHNDYFVFENKAYSSQISANIHNDKNQNLKAKKKSTTGIKAKYINVISVNSPLWFVCIVRLYGSLSKLFAHLS